MNWTNCSIKDLYFRKLLKLCSSKFRWLEALKEAETLRTVRHLFFFNHCVEEMCPLWYKKILDMSHGLGFLWVCSQLVGFLLRDRISEGSHNADIIALLWSTQPSEAFKLLNLGVLPLGNQSYLTTLTHCLEAGVSRVTCTTRGMLAATPATVWLQVVHSWKRGELGVLPGKLLSFSKTPLHC